MTDDSVKYVLDSNAFIESARRHYSFDIAQPFWDNLLKLYKEQKICSIDKVLEEIKLGDDELKDWVTNEGLEIFQSTKSDNVLEKYRSLVIWAQEQAQFTQNARDNFMEDNYADAWILAFALANDYKIVTHERYDRFIRRKIPIPNVCKAYNIPYCDIYKMLKEVNFSF